MTQWLKEGDVWDQLGGGLQEIEATFLKDLATLVSRPGMVGFDTGCFTGWTASQVWDIFGINGGHFYCVDWFLGNVESVVGTFQWGAYPSEQVLLQLLKNIEISNAKEFVSVIIDESWRPAALIPNASIDYVYIGGDHTYSGIQRDLLAWLPKVRPGGVICGHAYDRYVDPDSEEWKELCLQNEQDYYASYNCHFGVNRALHEIIKPGYSVKGNCWAAYRPVS